MLIDRPTLERGRSSGFRKARRKGPWFEMQDDGADSGEAVLKIYDEIDSVYGLGAEEFTAALDAVEADRLTVRINSPGGLIFDGLAIYHALRDHPATVTTRVDGVAASIASVIALAGDRVVMSSPASYFMIHNPTGVAVGSSEELLRTAELLERMEGSFAKLYSAKTGRFESELREEMAAESWFIGEEAVEMGFADEVTAYVDETAALELAARFNFAGFTNAPEALRHPAPGHADGARAGAAPGDRPAPASRPRARGYARRRMRLAIAARV